MSRKKESTLASDNSMSQERSHDSLAVAEVVGAWATGVVATGAYAIALRSGIVNGVHAETWWSVGVGGVAAMACGILALHHAGRVSGTPQ